MSFICEACMYEGHRRTTRPGSRGMEIFLWTVLLIPGPPYSLWRRMASIHSCPNCKSNGTMRRGWTGKGRMLRWEAEDKLMREIEEMEQRTRAEKGEIHDQTF